MDQTEFVLFHVAQPPSCELTEAVFSQFDLAVSSYFLLPPMWVTILPPRKL